MSFVIEDGIKIPAIKLNAGRAAGKFLTTLRLLDIGQSFEFEKSTQKHYSTVASNEGSRSAKKYKIRNIDEAKARIWRTA